jgi:AcrR family transcriptional regulator
MGRPRKEIDLAVVADVASDLFASGGYDAVSIDAVADRLNMARATLYRTITSKDHLLVILFERSTQRLLASTRELIAQERPAAEEFDAMVHLLAETAIETRRHLAVFFGGHGLPPDAYERWRAFTHDYEALWRQSITRAMKARVVPKGDPVLSTRLILGMLIWVSRWYRPDEEYTSDDIAAHVLRMVLHMEPAPARSGTVTAVRSSSNDRAGSSRGRRAAR